MLSTNSLEKSRTIEQSILEIGYSVGSINTTTAKRLLDIAGALTVFILFGWLFILIAFIVKITSKGSVIYYHERIGQNGIPFRIYKFRTMHTDAEKNGPQLSFNNDSRVTPLGKILRKLHLDELPQFYNVLIGDMSIIGVRPEREFYIQQIIEKMPHYSLALKNKPGITSWGQLMFGYAHDVDEMIERFKFDLYYMQHKSIKMDLKILVYTALLVVLGKNKLI